MRKRARPSAGGRPDSVRSAATGRGPTAPGRSGRAAAAARLREAALFLSLALAATLGIACAGPGTAEEVRRAAPATFPREWPFPADEPPVRSAGGMVVTTDSLASAAGLEVLRAGGNAVDAAVAVHFALAVVHPQAGNLGGGGFLVARLADGRTAALDFREKAPRGARRDMFLDSGGEPTDESWTGHLASGVPGSVSGMAAAHDRFGELPWERLLQPAIRLAEDGFAVTERLHAALHGHRERLSHFPASARTFLHAGDSPPVGSTFRQPELARTLRAIADGGADAFYRGWIADSLVAEMRRGGGIIGRDDLASYRAVWREPVEVRYRDRTVISMPPPSSGGVTLGLMLHILEGYELGSFGWRSADAIHRMVEAMRRAFADRNRWLGDPDFVEVPLRRLLSRAHADSLRATIDPDRASASEAFGLDPLEHEETTHYSVVDARGHAVGVSTTLNGSFGSAVTVPGAGFLLNNEMDDFTVKPGVPNYYGLVQGEANAIEPGKRMLSSMSPTIVVGPGGRTELVTGTPGGGTIISTVLQVVTAHVDWRAGAQAAVNAPRFHHQHLPDTVRYERGGLPAEVVEELRRRGHAVAERSGFSGDVHSIAVAPDGSRLGAADPRAGGRALGH